MIFSLAMADNVVEAAGRALAPCPDSPNCVSSEATDATHGVDPIVFEGSAEQAFARLKRVIAGFPRVRIVDVAGMRLRAEFTSRVFRFVDDVEAYVDSSARVIHVRSASRTGRYDFGVNRRRVEALRRRFETRTQSGGP